MLIVSDFKAVKLKIQADPEYLGDLPYIQVQNPQYRIRSLVHLPPKHGSGKWYSVTKGTCVGVYPSW